MSIDLSTATAELSELAHIEDAEPFIDWEADGDMDDELECECKDSTSFIDADIIWVLTDRYTVDPEQAKELARRFMQSDIWEYAISQQVGCKDAIERKLFAPIRAWMSTFHRNMLISH